MKIEDARLVIEPRSVGACIDLACLFYRAQTLKLLGLSALFGGPVTLLVYWLAVMGDFGWLWNIALFFLFSPFLGAAVVAGAGHWVFGEPFTLKGALTAMAERIGTLVYLLLLTRFILAASGIMCWGLPFVPLATRYGFLPEVVLLERLRGARVGKRIGELMSHTFWTAMGRYVVIVSFAAAVALTVFTVIDLGSGILLGFPILLGRTSSFFAEEIVYLIFIDPRVLSTISATLWLVYPLARLVWFFCYLDARIRKEGWDVELAFRVEAKRLQAVV